MKRRIGILALLLAACLCLGALPAHAAGEWSEEYYRAVDTSGELEDARRDDIDEQCLEFVAHWKTDLGMLALTPDRYEGMTLAEKAEKFYNASELGCGGTKDGFQLIYDVEAEKAELVPFGNAKALIPAEKLAEMAEYSTTFRAEHGVYGVMYATYRQLSNYMEDREKSGAAAPAAGLSDKLRERTVIDGVERGVPGKPDWYPVKTDDFPFYHDETAPRVVDDADIFPEDAEKRMEARLRELRETLGRDIVIYTDVSAYGLGHAVCAADFYDFNGYGIGPEREGMCLFICMDPDDRGFWTCCTGPDTRGLYSEAVANQMDDVLYEYMVAKEYAAGAEDWIENAARLYVKGAPFAPDWYPDRGQQQPERFQDAAAPRVVDEANVLSGDERAALEARAKELSAAYGLDIVLLTTDLPAGFGRLDYSNDFYRYNGYGLGADYNGLMLSAYRFSDHADCLVTSWGAAGQYLSSVNYDRLVDHCDSRLGGGSYYEAMNKWLDEVEHMLRTGRVPRTAGSWGASTAFEAVIAAIFGALGLGSAKKSMRTVRAGWNADHYLAGVRVDAVADDYTHTTTTRKYSPPPKPSSSSGGSSGRSSYSSSYHGSSGSSHSGSGRRF